jgi:hypothetical protein
VDGLQCASLLRLVFLLGTVTWHRVGRYGTTSTALHSNVASIDMLKLVWYAENMQFDMSSALKSQQWSVSSVNLAGKKASF